MIKRKEWIVIFKLIKIVAAAAAVSVTMCSCATTPSTTPIDPETIQFIQYDEISEGDEIAIVDTTLGEIRFVIFEDEAPNTVKHFKQLVAEGFYTDLPIVMEGEIKAFITGSSDDSGFEGKLVTEDGKKIEPEVNQNLWHFSGAVSAWGEAKNRFSRTMEQDSRFFFVGTSEANPELITQMEEYQYPEKVIDQYRKHGGMPEFTGALTVFGQVYQGMDVVDEIIASFNGGDAAVLENVRLNSIELSTYKKGE